MPARRGKFADTLNEPSPFFLSPEEWNHVRRSLQLSHRQADIVYQLLRGMDDKQIAAELAMSPFTVRSHLHSIFLRLDVKDRIGVVLRVFAVLWNDVASSSKTTS